MKRSIKIYITVALIGAAVLFAGFTNDKYYKIYHSFDVFSEVYKTITNYYVLDIDPDILAQSAVDGMLETLDPYSVYYDEQDYEDLDLINNNRYVGFGVSVNQIDSSNTIIRVNEGFAADKAGMKIGDKLYKIDGVEVLNLPSDDLRKYTNGQPNSSADVTVIRNIVDTLSLSVKRETISLKDVVYYDVLENDIAYIYLEGFSKKAPTEVRNAIKDMQRTHNLNGLILDLRGNPGGLLYSAIAICELFVPRGSMIVYTKGRDGEKIRTYKSTSDPLLPDLPLAVVINQGSASASEIVAGAIQDLDRGIVVGRTSYGKGLVQSVFGLSQNTNLKLTTAKYYTPSGRCIQRLGFGEKHREKIIDTLQPQIFYTENGREVTESIGIVPDSVIIEKELPMYIKDLHSNYLIFKFANNYAATHKELIPADTVPRRLLSLFEEYLLNNEYKLSSGLLEKIEDINKVAAEYAAGDKVLSKIEELKNIVIKEKLSIESEEYSDMLVEDITAEILTRYLKQQDYYAYTIKNNKTIVRTLELLKNQSEYHSILAHGSEKNGVKN